MKIKEKKYYFLIFSKNNDLNKIKFKRNIN